MFEPEDYNDDDYEEVDYEKFNIEEGDARLEITKAHEDEEYSFYTSYFILSVTNPDGKEIKMKITREKFWKMADWCYENGCDMKEEDDIRRDFQEMGSEEE